MRVLAVKTHAFGDALMATPAVAGLLKQGNEVSVLAGPSSYPVWERLSGLSEVILSPVPCSGPTLAFWSLKNRQKGFDRVIHLGSSQRVRRWLKFITGVGIEGGSAPETGFGKLRPAAADYCRMAGVHCDDLTPVFPLRPSERQLGEEIANGGKYAVLAPGGGFNPREAVVEKRWSIRGWAAVSEYLVQQGYQVVIVGGIDDVETASLIPGRSMAGELSWGETAGVISRAALFCGNDSGPAHLAVSLNIDSMVVFGPTDPGALYPAGSISAVTPSLDCSPCYANSVFPGCSNSVASACMESISEDTVINRIREMIGK